MKPGDKVTFTITKKSGKGFRLSSKEGVIESLNPDGDYATIKYLNGRKTIMPLSRLRVAGKITELTEAFLRSEEA
jgi:hypothetical protein